MPTVKTSIWTVAAGPITAPVTLFEAPITPGIIGLGFTVARERALSLVSWPNTVQLRIDLEIRRGGSSQPWEPFWSIQSFGGPAVEDDRGNLRDWSGSSVFKDASGLVFARATVTPFNGQATTDISVDQVSP